MSSAADAWAFSKQNLLLDGNQRTTAKRVFDAIQHLDAKHNGYTWDRVNGSQRTTMVVDDVSSGSESDDPAADRSKRRLVGNEVISPPRRSETTVPVALARIAATNQQTVERHESAPVHSAVDGGHPVPNSERRRDRPSRGNSFNRKTGKWRGYGHHVSVTANRWDVNSCQRLNKFDGVGYFIRGQVECAPKTGRKHLQLYLFQRDRKSYHATRAWIDQLIGFQGNEIKFCESAIHAQRTYEYVHKGESAIDGTRFESGKAIVPQFVKNGPGAPESDEDEDTVAGQDPIQWKDVIYLFGPHRTGKGHLAGLIAGYLGDEYVYRVPGKVPNQSGRWLGKYMGQPFIICDEFDPSQFDNDYLKMMFDSAPQTLTTVMGGASARFWPAMIILINNFSVDKAVKWASLPQWKGRIKMVAHMCTPIPAVYAPPVEFRL